MFIKALLTFCLIIIFTQQTESQIELVPLSNTVYDYLDRMATAKLIDYSSSFGPLSRREVASYLVEISSRRAKLSNTDKKLLEDFLTEFSFDINGKLDKSSLFFSRKGFGELFSNRKQKYLWASADSNVSFFWDGLGEIRYMGLDGDSAGKPHVLLAQLGTRIRGTLFNSVGYYLRLSNGLRLGGSTDDANRTAFLDPQLSSTRKFVSEGGRTFDSYEGHLRYSPRGNWLGLTLGREALRSGTGYIDRLILSNLNSAPFDFIKLDLQYKKIKYSFLHSSIVGNDSVGKQLESKYLVFHRLELGPFINNSLKIGFSEMVVYSNIPVNFAFLNPISFLTSADLNTELPGKNSNNTLLGIDFEIIPVKNFSVQGSLLIDDLNFETLGAEDTKGNDNKFGFQAGLNWQNAFMLPNLRFIYEYTRLDPFVYSHREINNSYSHWNLPLGHSLNPNSDEHAVKLTYNLGSRVMLSVTYKAQRTGLNYIDSLGNFVNVGSDILNGSGDFLIKNKFLNGKRLNRNLISAEITWQPVRQYYITLKYQRRTFDFISPARNLTDNIFWGSFRIDY